MLLLRRKVSLVQEKREYEDNWSDFLWENQISELLKRITKKNITIMFM